MLELSYDNFFLKLVEIFFGKIVANTANNIKDIIVSIDMTIKLSLNMSIIIIAKTKSGQAII